MKPMMLLANRLGQPRSFNATHVPIEGNELLTRRLRPPPSLEPADTWNRIMISRGTGSAGVLPPSPSRNRRNAVGSEVAHYRREEGLSSNALAPGRE